MVGFLVHSKASVEKSDFHIRMSQRGRGMLGSRDPDIVPYTGLKREWEVKTAGTP